MWGLGRKLGARPCVMSCSHSSGVWWCGVVGEGGKGRDKERVHGEDQKPGPGVRGMHSMASAPAAGEEYKAGRQAGEQAMSLSGNKCLGTLTSTGRTTDRQAEQVDRLP